MLSILLAVSNKHVNESGTNNLAAGMLLALRCKRPARVEGCRPLLRRSRQPTAQAVSKRRSVRNQALNRRAGGRSWRMGGTFVQIFWGHFFANHFFTA